MVRQLLNSGQFANQKKNCEPIRFPRTSRSPSLLNLVHADDWQLVARYRNPAILVYMHLRSQCFRDETKRHIRLAVRMDERRLG